MQDARPPELRIIREKLSSLYEGTLTEALPKRWVELIHALNEREKRNDESDTKVERTDDK